MSIAKLRQLYYAKMIMFLRIVFVTVCFVLPLVLSAKHYTICGYVTDSLSSESLLSATIYATNHHKGAATNSYGFYSLTLPEGECQLQFSYVGYSTQTRTLNLSSDTIFNVRLSSNNLLSEVEVLSERVQGVETSQMSAIELPINFIKGIPSVGGESDIIKAMQLLPGVQSGSEGQVGLYVRGGGPDENLILLDEVPLYNISHMLGLFSVFNADIVKNVTLYKGNFPAKYGGRLSSVLDIRQKDGNMQEYHGSLSVGLLSAKVNLEGPIWKNHTSFNISARRTYFDWLFPLIYQIGSSESMGSGEYMGYAFWDVNAKITHRFSDYDRLSASFYMGDDNMYSNIESSEEDYKIKSKNNWMWGNLLASLNWNHIYSPQLFSTASLSYSRYRFSIGVDMNEHDITNSVDTRYNMNYGSNIEDVIARYSFDYEPHPNHHVEFGAQYAFHIFTPAIMSAYGHVIDQGQKDVMDTTYGNAPIYTHEASLFVQDDWDICRRLKLNVGLRGSLYAIENKVYPNLEPRIGLRLLLLRDLSFKASYQYISQYVHLLSSSNLMLPIDLWVPVTRTMPPMTSHQVAAGFFYNIPNIADISVEGYYKSMNNLIEYKEGTSLITSTDNWNEKINLGRGWSYGVEFLVQRTIGKFTGLIGYTWSRTERKFDREGMVINGGKTFPARYDRTHDLSVSLQYRPTKLIDLSATFVYGTGACGTLATQIMPDGSAVATSRNNYRLPDYHRLDLGINFHFDRRKGRYGEHLLSVGFYNVYNHQNPFYVYVEYDYQNKKRVLNQVSLFPILPSISYTFRF